MTHFCDNPLCTHHIEVKGRPMEFEFLEENRKCRYRVHPYPIATHTIHLCDVCHQAVLLVTSPGTEANTQQEVAHAS